MPANRGAHPEDPEMFGASEHPRLRAAVHDLSWLRSRGYGAAAKELVGDRYRLKRRQRDVVGRCACSDEEQRHRRESRLRPGQVAGCTVDIDTFNVLVTMEAALGGAFLFVGRDTAYRDVNPLRGTYRIVQQTEPAIQLLTRTLKSLDVATVRWHLDQSVSNVGRVKDRLETVPKNESSWTTRVTQNVDNRLKASEPPVVTSDSDILDATDAWLHLEALVVARHILEARLVDLRPDGERAALPEWQHWK